MIIPVTIRIVVESNAHSKQPELISTLKSRCAHRMIFAARVDRVCVPFLSYFSL